MIKCENSKGQSQFGTETIGVPTKNLKGLSMNTCVEKI